MKELNRNVIVFIESESAVYMFVKRTVWYLLISFLFFSLDFTSADIISCAGFFLFSTPCTLWLLEFLATLLRISKNLLNTSFKSNDESIKSYFWILASEQNFLRAGEATSFKIVSYGVKEKGLLLWVKNLGFVVVAVV